MSFHLFAPLLHSPLISSTFSNNCIFNGLLSIPIPVFILHALYPSCLPSHSGDQNLGADVAAPACTSSVYQWVDRHARELLSTASVPWRLAHLADTDPLC